MKRAPILLAGLLASACGNDATPPMNQAPPEYHRDIKPLLDRYCNECHQPGGIAPFSLQDLDSVKRHGPVIRDAVDQGRMPPWMPSDKGLPLAYSRKMRSEDKAQLLSFLDLGAPEGDPKAAPRTDLPPAPSVRPPREDLVLSPPDVYMPNMGVSDDYRCFVIDPKLTEDVYVRAGNVRPDNKAIVHHVLVFEIQESDKARLLKKDADEPGPGYTCYGGPGVGNIGVSTVMGWAPGGVGYRSSEEVAIRVRKGSMLVMQMHYNMVNFKGVGDKSTVVFELDRTPPKRVATLIPIANPRELKIAAGDANAKQIINVPVALLQSFLKWPAGEMTLWSNAPHMHVLGTRIETSIQDGPTIVEIPKWDFHWQGGYILEKPYVLSQSDTIRVECHYDNSMANPNQHSNPPRDVTWGEGTLDEMCLSYVLATPGGI